MIITRRHLRLAGFFAIGWFLVETLLFYLLSRAIGFFPALMLMTAKGVLGFLLFASQLRAVLGKIALREWKNGLAAISDSSFAAAGAFLIFLPGVLTTLAGLALFAPSVRTGIVRWMRREKKAGRGDGVVSLDANEWREIERGGSSSIDSAPRTADRATRPPVPPAQRP